MKKLYIVLLTLPAIAYSAEYPPYQATGDPFNSFEDLFPLTEISPNILDILGVDEDEGLISPLFNDYEQFDGETVDPLNLFRDSFLSNDETTPTILADDIDSQARVAEGPPYKPTEGNKRRRLLDMAKPESSKAGNVFINYLTPAGARKRRSY